MEKPDSIRKFDLLYLASIALSLVNFALSYNILLDQVRTESAAAGVELGGGVLIAGISFSTLVSLLLWFLISKKRVEFIKWILILFLVWSFASLPSALGDGIILPEILALLIGLVQVAAVWFLFRPEAKEWFAEK